jgi:hypothetical protein
MNGFIKGVDELGARAEKAGWFDALRLDLATRSLGASDGESPELKTEGGLVAKEFPTLRTEGDCLEFGSEKTPLV